MCRWVGDGGPLGEQARLVPVGEEGTFACASLLGRYERVCREWDRLSGKWLICGGESSR